MDKLTGQLMLLANTRTSPLVALTSVNQRESMSLTLAKIAPVDPTLNIHIVVKTGNLLNVSWSFLFCSSTPHRMRPRMPLIAPNGIELGFRCFENLSNMLCMYGAVYYPCFATRI